MKKTLSLSAKCVFLLLSVFTLLTSCSKSSVAPPAKKWVVTTVAGSSTAGFTDGDSTHAQFSNLQGITTDNNGNLFVGDVANASIRQVTYSGHVTTYTGKNITTPDPLFGNIYGLVRDSQGNLYTIEYNLVRKITTATSNAVFAGSLTESYADGTGSNASFNVIGNMTIDKQNNIFLPDYGMDNAFHIRKITPAGVVSTLTLQDNTGISSNAPPTYFDAIAVDGSGNIYVTASGNCLIKKVDASGNVTVLAGAGNVGFKDGKGTAAQFNTITGITCDASGNLWVCDSDNHAIRKVTADGTVTTIAGGGGPGYSDGSGSAALFKYPFGITVDNSGVLYVTDNGNNRVRKLEYK